MLEKKELSKENLLSFSLMNLERLLFMATITKEVGNRRFPCDLNEEDSAICVRESLCMEVYLSFWISQEGSKEDP